jgi:DNA replication protein
MNKFKINQIDYRYILVDTYKSMGLNEYDLAVLLVVDNILKETPVLITSELLALKMSLDVKELDSILVSLVNRGFLEYDTIANSNSLVTSMAPTYNKISENFIRDLITYQSLEDNDSRKLSISNIYGTFEKELGRSLSPVELERIREWISQGIQEEVIIDSLHECMAKNKKVTIRSIDKIIIKRLSSKDLKEEGYSAINDKWKKELEDTIDIANTKWTDD